MGFSSLGSRAHGVCLTLRKVPPEVANELEETVWAVVSGVKVSVSVWCLGSQAHRIRERFALLGLLSLSHVGL